MSVHVSIVKSNELQGLWPKLYYEISELDINNLICLLLLSNFDDENTMIGELRKHQLQSIVAGREISNKRLQNWAMYPLARDVHDCPP